MLYEVIPAKSFGSKSDDNSGILTYCSDLELKPGQTVLVPLRKSTVPAIILKKSTPVDFPVKPISKLLYETPLPEHIMKSLLWLSSYYLTPLPTVASLILPVGIDRNRRKKSPESTTKTSDLLKSPTIPLNPSQKQALQAIESVSTATKLLHGVTGSGKTNIYLKLAENALKTQKSVIVLVPEIALTSQLVQVFESTFKTKVSLLHSRQTEAERHLIWENLLNDSSPRIIIGPRSALFAPVKDLGLIIIDESHESAYFQENPPKYSALKLASFIASSLKISCIQGSATPIISDYHLAKKNQAIIRVKDRAKDTAIKPNITVIDLKSKNDFGRNRYFSLPLLNAIKNNIENHHQTIIFHNRRGSSPLTICENCGWQALCPTCFLPLTLHTDLYKLVCHACGHQEAVPLSCPSCNHPDVIHKGFGTKLLESELKKLFKEAKIARFDADNTKETSLDALYDQVKTGDFDIIIGTQTIAKGLDLPHLATVGVVQADSGLNLPDFAAEERTFHLLTQVIGRVGRGHLKTAEVFIQTYQPEHPVVSFAVSENYDDFAEYLLKVRRKAFLPPFCFLAKLSLTYKTEATTLKNIKLYHKSLQNTPGIIVSSPTPAFHERSSSGFTWELVVKSTSRKNLLSAIQKLKKSPNLHLTIDPPSLL